MRILIVEPRPVRRVGIWPRALDPLAAGALGGRAVVLAAKVRGSTNMAMELVAALRANDLAAVRELVDRTPAAVNAKGSAGRTPIHVAVALRRRDALEVMLATGAADLELTSDEPDFQTAMDLAEELSHAMVVRLLRLHGARTSGKRAYAPKSEQQNQVVSLGGQTITLTPEQQAASASNRRLMGVAFVMIFVFGLDWRLTLAACYIYYKMSGGDAAPGGFDQLKAAVAPPPPPPAPAPPPANAQAGAAAAAGAKSTGTGLLKKQYKEAKAASERDPSSEALKAEYRRAKHAYKVASGS